MKIALCFIISYEHILNKEDIWREWIEPNKDIINIYFYYKDLTKIKSEWIMRHTIPPNYIHETSYYHVIPAYASLMSFAINHDDNNNTWFCMLTDSCCPIISPKRFRYLFYNYYNKSILSWKKAWWNIEFHKRANLALLPEEFRLANDPWFVMKREHVHQCLLFINNQQKITKTICSGGLANESLFAIIMYAYKQIDFMGKNVSSVISNVSHMTDWYRCSSPTSPHLFKDGNELDIKFITKSLENDKFVMFIRKIAPEFPNDIIREFIYEKTKVSDKMLDLRVPPFFIFINIKKYINLFCQTVLPFFLLFYIIKYITA